MRVSPDKLTLQSPKGFIVLDGVNGAGKSSLMRHLIAVGEKAGKPVHPTFEPGDSVPGKAIRSLLLGQNSPDNSLTPLSEILLFAADRNLHVNKIIKPALSRGELVISDRYLYSSVAFQGYGRGQDCKFITEINEMAVENLLPDVVFLLDLDPAEGLKRTKGRAQNGKQDDKDSFEKEQLEFHHRLRNGFLEMAETRKEPFIVIDASRPMAEVFGEAEKAFLTLLRN